MHLASPGSDFFLTNGAELQFTSVSTNRSLSSNQVVIQIIDDDVLEPRESFFCTLQQRSNDTNSVLVTFPSQVTIVIEDNDGEHQYLFKQVSMHHC